MTTNNSEFNIAEYSNIFNKFAGKGLLCFFSSIGAHCAAPKIYHNLLPDLL